MLAMFWRVLTERQERRGRDSSFPALSSQRLLQESRLHSVPSLPNRAETARNERRQQVGLSRRTASSRKDKVANSEPQEQPTNGSSLAGSQALPNTEF